MTIKVYVNHRDEDIVTEKEFFEKIVPDEISALRTSDTFNDWLIYESNLTLADAFYLKEEEKEKIKQEYENYLHDKTIADLEDNGWNCIQLEI